MSEQRRGKYDDLCEHMLAVTEAFALAVIVMGGSRGHGFSISFLTDAPGMASTTARMAMAYALRAAADDLEKGAASS